MEQIDDCEHEALQEMQKAHKQPITTAELKVNMEDVRAVNIKETAEPLLQLLHNQELFVKYFPLLSKDLYTEKTDILLFNDIAYFYDEYKTIPNISEINQMIKDDQFSHRYEVPTEFWNTEYLEDQTRHTIEYGRVRIAMEDSIEMLTDQNYGGIHNAFKEALDVDFNDSLGTSVYDIDDIFEDITSAKKYLPTGWATLDDMLGGGVQIPSLNYFIAKSGGGKSVTLINMAHSFVKQGRDVLYVSLELSGNEIMNRYYTHLMKQKTKDFNVNSIKKKLLKGAEAGHGEFVSMFKQPGSLSSLELESMVRKYINTHDGRVPIIIVDYAGLMKANNFHPQMAVFEKDKAISEELRAVATLFDTVVWTVEQFNRTGLGDKEANEVSEENVQGGISKLQTCDNMFAMIPSSVSRDINVINCKVFKARNAPIAGRYFSFLVDWDSLSFKDNPNSQPAVNLHKKKDETFTERKDKPKRSGRPNGNSLKTLKRL